MLVLISIDSFSQSSTQTISGRVVDGENNLPIVGSSVIVLDTKQGTNTDVDGRFFLRVSGSKKISIEVSNLGYAPKILEDISVAEIGSGLEITLTREHVQLEQVTIKVSARKESTSALYLQQKNSSAISDGIAAEVIRKSPDRNTGEILKRVSGASVQDNKFVVIRGLSERYNTSMLNNSVLPSTEPDKKAFSFDIIPASIVDNLVIYKSATPDLPGDFSGGAIKISTKDYPSKPLSELSINIGYNSLTTFKNFYTGYPEGKLDWLGFFDHSRLIPGSYYSNRGSAFINLSDEQKTATTKQFSNTYGYQAAYQSMPNFSVSYTGGNTKLLANTKKLGYVYSVGYSTGRRASSRARDEYQDYSTLDYSYLTDNYAVKNNLAAMLNLTYSYGKSKISWKNLFNNDFEKVVGIRNGYNVINGPEYRFDIRSTKSEPSQNGIFNSVVEGLHSLKNSWTIDWNASYGLTYRWQPDQKILAFHTDYDDPRYKLTLSNENSPEISNAGRVYSFLTENIYGGGMNATKQFKWLNQNQKLKIGGFGYYRSRDVEVNALGYSVLNSYGHRASIYESKTASFNNIFSPENIDTYHLTVATIGANSTDYKGTAFMNGGYIMMDNRFGEKFKLTWGARMENYDQKVTALNQKDIDLNNLDILPSFLLTYSLNKKSNLRLGASKAVNRPEFRELADYRIYDYDNDFIVIGNPTLVRCKNTNADLRYEWFPAAGEVISASVFYKYFDHPIEQVNKGNNILSYDNADNANAYGAEIEIRKKLDFIGGSFFNQLTFYANAAYIKGSVQFAEVNIKSPLQGQSPYVLNGGLSYTSPGDDFSVNLLYNRIGSRLRYRAITSSGIPGGKNIFEKPRDVLDFQVAKNSSTILWN